MVRKSRDQVAKELGDFKSRVQLEKDLSEFKKQRAGDSNKAGLSGPGDLVLAGKTAGVFKSNGNVVCYVNKALAGTSLFWLSSSGQDISQLTNKEHIPADWPSTFGQRTTEAESTYTTGWPNTLGLLGEKPQTQWSSGQQNFQSLEDFHSYTRREEMHLDHVLASINRLLESDCDDEACHQTENPPARSS